MTRSPFAARIGPSPCATVKTDIAPSVSDFVIAKTSQGPAKSSSSQSSKIKMPTFIGEPLSSKIVLCIRRASCRPNRRKRGAASRSFRTRTPSRCGRGPARIPRGARRAAPTRAESTYCAGVVPSLVREPPREVPRAHSRATSERGDGEIVARGDPRSTRADSESGSRSFACTASCVLNCDCPPGRCKNTTSCLATSQRERPAVILGDEREREVDPRRDARGRVDRPVLDEDPIGLDVNLREPRRQSRAGIPVRRRAHVRRGVPRAPAETRPCRPMQSVGRVSKSGRSLDEIRGPATRLRVPGLPTRRPCRCRAARAEALPRSATTPTSKRAALPPARTIGRDSRADVRRVRASGSPAKTPRAAP